MSTEIATRQAGVPSPVGEPSALLLWAQDAHQANVIAQMLAKTSFVPASLRGKPDDLTAALLAGQELGLQPMATLRSMDVIQGTPALRAHAMRGLVQSRGYEVEVVESDDLHCVMRGRRGVSAAWQSVTWDLDRAKKLGLTGKDQWVKQPRTMLIARATGEICRLIAADVLYAMPYAAEELDEAPIRATATAGPVTIASLTTSQVPASDAQTGSKPYATPEQIAELERSVAAMERNPRAAVSEEEGQREPVDIGDAPPAITPAAMRRLHALLGKTGRADRDEGLQYLTLLLGRPVDTTKTLTAAESRIAIDDMEAQLAAAAEVNAEAQPELT